MNEFIVSYDLRSTEDDNPEYEILIEYLQSLNHCRIQQSVWLVSFVNQISIGELFDNIKEYMSKEDSLFICTHNSSVNNHGKHDNFENCYNTRKTVYSLSTKTNWGTKLNLKDKLIKNIEALEIKLNALTSNLKAKHTKNE